MFNTAHWKFVGILLTSMLLGSLSVSQRALADEMVIVNCPPTVHQRANVLESLSSLGTRLALGRLCAVQEATLHEIKTQTLNRYSGCLQNFQVKATEIQDALEAGRTGARDTYKHAKNKSSLCEEVRLATN